MDASTKIYGFRVDVVYNDTFKLASGLTQSSKQKVYSLKPEILQNIQNISSNRQTKILTEATWRGRREMVLKEKRG